MASPSERLFMAVSRVISIALLPFCAPTYLGHGRTSLTQYNACLYFTVTLCVMTTQTNLRWKWLFLQGRNKQKVDQTFLQWFSVTKNRNSESWSYSYSESGQKEIKVGKKKKKKLAFHLHTAQYNRNHRYHSILSSDYLQFMRSVFDRPWGKI